MKYAKKLFSSFSKNKKFLLPLLVLCLLLLMHTCNFRRSQQPNSNYTTERQQNYSTLNNVFKQCILTMYLNKVFKTRVLFSTALFCFAYSHRKTFNHSYKTGQIGRLKRKKYLAVEFSIIPNTSHEKSNLLI